MNYSIKSKSDGVEHIVLAEFDIDLGSTTRIQFPTNVPNIDAGTLSDYMIPEGSHKFGVLNTYFTVGRKSTKDLNSELLKTVQNPSYMQSKLLDEVKLSKLQTYWKE
jgi:hypothetical protein